MVAYVKMRFKLEGKACAHKLHRSAAVGRDGDMVSSFDCLFDFPPLVAYKISTGEDLAYFNLSLVRLSQC